VIKLPWKVPLFDLSIGEEEVQAVQNVLRSKWISMGSVTKEFEDEFTKRHGVRHAIAVTNCTAALHLALKALGIGEGDEVICPSLTFVATANSILYAGAKPVFAEVISREDLTVSPEDIERKITDKTKAIIVVHYGGYPCEMDKIVDIANKYNLKIIEDCAHSPLAEYKGKKVGAWGDIGCFSFFSNKNMTTAEGGIITTNDDDIAEKVILMRSHGMTALSFDKFKGHAVGYDVVELGYNYRIDDIRSSIGIVQLNKLESFNARRRELIKLYIESLLGIEEIIVPFRHLTDARDILSSFHIFPILVNTSKIKQGFVREELGKKGIQTSVHYQPVHLFKIYRERFGYRKGYLPLTEWTADHEITLPLYPSMGEREVLYVVESLKDILGIH
jgi:dTDP-4-amino-4,6-dideoxygalactose transaminase